jgi:protein-disulfide isomerase
LTGAAPTFATKVTPPGANTPLEEARRWITEDPDAPMIAPNGYDVTIVEYIDYQCPACRASQEPLTQLLQRDKKVRVIFRDWPIFGSASEKAARLALASKYQGKYLAFHNALFEMSRPLDEVRMRAAARRAGVDWTQLEKDLKTHSREIEDLLARNSEQAETLGLEGTPGFVIGHTQTFGAMTLKHLQVNVKNARSGLG